MDRDITIIEAVRKEPCLYVDSFNIEERNRGWKQLSEKLKIKDQHLKIRWHLLVQRYQSNASFKYAQQMEFVERKCKSKIRSGNWPEFEITEEDVEDNRTNSDEYVFLDLEENSSTDPRLDDVKEENDDQNNDIPSECHDYSSLSSPIAPNKNDTNKCDKKANKPSMQTIYSECKQNIEKSSHNKQNIPSAPESDKAVVENITDVTSTKPPADRSEDDIFGELVAAMLKRMDADKKRMAKKEIMNILLT